MLQAFQSSMSQVGKERSSVGEEKLESLVEKVTLLFG